MSQPPTTLPAPVAEATPQPSPHPHPHPHSDEPHHQTFTQRLSIGEDKWPWKVGLRVVVILISLIGIGCAGWIASQRASHNGNFDTYYSYVYEEYYLVPWTLITFCVSVVWCLVCILVLLLRRPNAPVHPGVAVALDLVLWLSYIVTGLVAIVGLLSVISYGDRGTFGYSSEGTYEQDANGTWVFYQTAYEKSRYPVRSCDSPSGGYARSNFESCAEQDAYVNQLWREKRHRTQIVKTITVCQFLNLALHFALFVWACVDCHRRNRGKVGRDAKVLANDIVMNMVRNGALVPTNQGMGAPLVGNQGMGQPGQPMQQQSWNQEAQSWGGQLYQAGPSQMLPPQNVVVAQEKGDAGRFA